MLLSSLRSVKVVAQLTSAEDVGATMTAHTPDVVIVDTQLEHCSWSALCQQIRDDFGYVGIIMLTNSDAEADLRQAFHHGAGGYLLKSSSLEQLVEAIHQVAAGEALLSPALIPTMVAEFRQLLADEHRELPRLTQREQEVIELVGAGMNNRDIAAALYLSENTVKNHVASILAKFEVSSRLEAVVFALRHGLITNPF